MLDISIWLILFTAAVFLSLIYILDKILYKPLFGFMNKRDAMIEDDLKGIKQNSGEVEESLKKADEIISHAKGEAHTIRESATLKAKEGAQQELKVFQDEIEKKYSSFASSLNNDKSELREKLASNLSTYKSGLKSKLKSI